MKEKINRREYKKQVDKMLDRCYNSGRVWQDELLRGACRLLETSLVVLTRRNHEHNKQR
jgi:hypothetical protein